MKLIFEHLFKYLNNNLILKDIDFSLESRKLAIIGHNGSGKTTLLSLIAGLLKPDEGYVSIDGIEPFFEREKIVKHLSFIFEKGNYSYNMSVGNYVKILKKIRDEKYVNDIADILELSKFENANMKELSTGQAQLVYLLSVLTSNKKIIILDEPFSHLDPGRYIKITKFIQNMEKDFILATQSFNEAEELCDEYIVLKEGEILWKGSKKDLYKNNLFEIYLNENNIPGLNVISDMGKVLIAEARIDYLVKLLEDGKILGFKRAGLRRIYGEINLFN